MVSLPSERPVSFELPPHEEAGVLGLFGYAGDGITKSLDRALHQNTMKRILAAKLAEAESSKLRNNDVVADQKLVKAFTERRTS